MQLISRVLGVVLALAFLSGCAGLGVMGSLAAGIGGVMGAGMPVTPGKQDAAAAAGELQILQTGIQMDEVQEHAGWKAGTVWKGLKDGSPHQMTHVSVTGTSETIRESDGCMWTRPKSFYAPSTEWTNCTSRDGKATVELKRPIFPFHVGKTWAFNVDAGRWRTSRECTVLDTARVRTVSGEHDTFKIVCKDRWNTRTRYYAPKLGTMVYYERHHRKRGQRTKYELIKIESTTLSGAGSEQKQVSQVIALSPRLSTSRKQDAAIAVAVFPLSHISSLNWANYLLPEFAHKYISENSQLRMVASYFKNEDSKIGSPTDYWSPVKKPLISRIYSDGARIDADAVLMYSFSSKYTIDDRFDVTVYLFDVKNRYTYQSSGNQDNYKRLTASLFKELIAQSVSTRGTPAAK